MRDSQTGAVQAPIEQPEGKWTEEYLCEVCEGHAYLCECRNCGKWICQDCAKITVDFPLCPPCREAEEEGPQK
jgi:hypothetical protein